MLSCFLFYFCDTISQILHITFNIGNIRFDVCNIPFYPRYSIIGCFQLTTIDSVRRCVRNISSSYTTYFSILVYRYFIIDCNSTILVKFYRGLVIRNSISSDIHICQFSPLICIDFIFCCNRASRFNGAIGSANAYILASDITKKKILIQAYFISLLPVLICFFYGNIATIDYFCMFPSFLLYSMELTAIDGIGRVGSNSTCRYTANTTSIINRNFAKFCILRGNLTVIAVRISYVQFSITKSTVFIEYAIIQLYISSFDTSIFVYNKFTTSCIESPIRIYKEWHFAIGCGCTHGQIIFRIQSVSLNIAKFCILRGNLTVIAVCISYVQFSITKSTVFIEYAIIQLYISSFDTSIFVYNKFTTSCIESPIRIYKEWHFAIGCGCTHGQIIFRIQNVSLNIINIDILIQAYFISLLPVLICFFYGNIATIDYFCMFPGFLLYSMELTAIDGICRGTRNFTSSYTANFAALINGNPIVDCYSATISHADRR